MWIQLTRIDVIYFIFNAFTVFSVLYRGSDCSPKWKKTLPLVWGIFDSLTFGGSNYLAGSTNCLCSLNTRIDPKESAIANAVTQEWLLIMLLTCVTHYANMLSNIYAFRTKAKVFTKRPGWLPRLSLWETEWILYFDHTETILSSCI